MRSEVILPTLFAICAVWIGIGLAKGILLRCLSILGLGIDAVLGLPLFRFSPLCRRLSDRLEGWAKTIQKDPASRNVVGFGLLLVGVASVLVWAASPKTYVLEWDVRAASKAGLVQLGKGTKVPVVSEDELCRTILVGSEKIILFKKPSAPAGVLPPITGKPRLTDVLAGPFEGVPYKTGILKSQNPVYNPEVETSQFPCRIDVQIGQPTVFFAPGQLRILYKGKNAVWMTDEKYTYLGQKSVLGKLFTEDNSIDNLIKQADRIKPITWFTPAQVERIKKEGTYKRWVSASYEEVDRLLFWSPSQAWAFHTNIYIVNSPRDYEKASVWESVLGMNPESIDPALAADMTLIRTGQRKPEGYVYSRVSMRPKFEAWNLPVRGKPEGNYACTIRAMSDLLSFLWSEKLGKPVVISAASLTNEYTRRGGVLSNSPEEVNAPPGSWIDVFFSDGAANLAKASPQKTTWENMTIDVFPSFLPGSQVPKAVGMATQGLNGLMMKALREGKPLFWTGMFPVPLDGKRGEEIQFVGKSVQFPRSEPIAFDSGPHAVIITGYEIRQGARSPVLLWEVRNNWGTDYGKGGYALIPSRQLSGPTDPGAIWGIRAVSLE